MRVFNTNAIVFTAVLIVGFTGQPANAGAHSELPPIQVPEGFKATVFHPGLGATRQIAVRDNGDVYVAREMRQERRMFGQKAAWGAIIAMRDEDGDGVADIVEPFGPTDVGDALRIHDGYSVFLLRSGGLPHGAG